MEETKNEIRTVKRGKFLFSITIIRPCKVILIT